MIIRVFRATVHPGKEQEFTDFFHTTGYQKVTAHAGCKEVRIGLPLPDSPQDFVMVQVWESVDALREFAGDNWREAVIHPDEAPLLAAVAVDHYDLSSMTPLD